MKKGIISGLIAVVVLVAVSCENSSNSVEPLESKVTKEDISGQKGASVPEQTIDKDAYVFVLDEGGEVVSTEVLTTAIEIEAVFSEEIIEELQSSFIVEISDSAEVSEISEILFPDLFSSTGQEVQEIVVVYSDRDLLGVSLGCLKGCGLSSSTSEEFGKCIANCKTKGGSKFNFYKDW